MSGGYAADINDTVEIHCNTIRAVRHIFDSAQHPPLATELRAADFGLKMRAAEIL